MTDLLWLINNNNKGMLITMPLFIALQSSFFVRILAFLPKISLPMCEIRRGQGGTESFLSQLLLFPLPVIVLPLLHSNIARCSGTDPTARSQMLSLQDACFLSDQHFAEPRITTPHHKNWPCYVTDTCASGLD